MIEAEVIVIGGGPAGSTCAWKLKQGGKDVLLLDKKQFPRLKLCAGWITPRVLRHLKMNLQTYPHSLLKFKRLNFIIGGRRYPVPTRQYSIRRVEFDAWLLERAGVPVQQHKVQSIRRENSNYIIDDAYRCTYLVGAGGTHCPVYHNLFKEINPRAQERVISALELEFPYDYPSRECYLWFTENNLVGYSWYVPKGNGYLNIGIGGKLDKLKARGETIRTHWNLLLEKLDKLELVQGQDLKPSGYNYYLRREVIVGQRDNAFITGDAAGLATLDMGEGIGPAVESGILAARAILTGKPYSLKKISKYSAFDILFPW